MPVIAPIFLFCYSRGGSNIFWNLFLSHPDACSPILETVELFSTRFAAPRLDGLKAVALTGQWHIFDNWWLEERRSISVRAQNHINQTFTKWKMKTFSDLEMRFKYENEPYTIQEVVNCRLVTKNNNGLTFLSDIYCTMYPDATFFALVREPLALYESHKRRKITNSPEEFARFYNRIAKRMLEDSERMDRYYILRFEDILADPLATVQNIYQQANLDFDKISKLRLKAKPHWQTDGTHGTQLEKGVHYWLGLEELNQLLEPRINQYQVDRLTVVEQSTISNLTGTTCAQLGYE